MCATNVHNTHWYGFVGFETGKQKAPIKEKE